MCNSFRQELELKNIKINKIDFKKICSWRWKGDKVKLNNKQQNLIETHNFKILDEKEIKLFSQKDLTDKQKFNHFKKENFDKYSKSLNLNKINITKILKYIWYGDESNLTKKLIKIIKENNIQK